MERDERVAGHAARGRRTALLIFAGVVLLVLCGGYAYARHRRSYVSTDDAFIEGVVHTIAPRVGGAVVRVAVEDNTPVRAGDVLVEVDREPFEVALAQAQAALEAARRAADAAGAALHEARAATARLDAAVSAREAECAAKSALEAKARVDRERAHRLFAQGIIADDQAEQADTAADAATAARRAAEALLKEARAARTTHDAVIAQAEAAVRRAKGEVERAQTAVRGAELQLAYTRVTAPAAGFVTKKSVEVGDVLAPGRPVMAVVPTDGLYVVANYKETQTANIRPGLAVRMTVDAFPGRTFRGRVESIMAGTGAVFSLFPPENATGNYVKVVQRIPVKIVFEPDQSLDGLRLGMSVVPTVILR